MRKLLVLIIAPILLFTGLQAQTITQEQADALVLEKMSGETRPYSIFAKEDIQPAGTVLETSAGEVMVFEYEHWLYYICMYIDYFTSTSSNIPPPQKYCIVKANGGSLLEVNTNNDYGPNTFDGWKKFDWCDCNDELYYYYKGEKKWITLHSHFDNKGLVLDFAYDLQNVEIIEFIEQTGLFMPVNPKFIFRLAGHDGYEGAALVYVRTKKQHTCTQLKEIIETLQNNDIVISANLSFFTDNFGFKCSASYIRYFYVTVNNPDDLTDLYSVAEETNTTVLFPYSTTMYCLRATKNSMGNSIQMANYFYETGKFSGSFADYKLLPLYPFPSAGVPLYDFPSNKMLHITK